jgi:hypothetical protein
MTSIVDRLLGRQSQPGQAHDGCSGHSKGEQHAAHGGAEHATGGCCGGSHHKDHTEEAAASEHEAPVETAGSRP